MNIKARIGRLECPKKYWGAVNKFKVEKEIPQEIINQVINLWDHLKTGVAKTQEDKRKMIELWNVISGSNYKPSTNCGSCIAAAFDGVRLIYKKYKK